MPSLYETTAAVGDVESSNFTTLYNASGLTVPNAGAGTVSGNLNVGGNLTVQGTSLLQGAVTLGSTLCLPNYCFPLPDGSNYQVLATDGSGNLYWSNITAIPGADYNIAANTTTGGANLTLSNTSGSVVDNVKFAGGTNITVTRTDANTITISTSADDIPNGTARGQVLYWDGSAWTANNVISANAAGNRLTAVYENSTAGPNSAVFLRKDYGATNYSSANNDGVGLNFSLTSNSQGISQYGGLFAEYSTTDPEFYFATSTDNFATRTLILKADKTNVGIYAPEFVLNKDQTGSPTLDAVIRAERGSSTDATITWNETLDRWDISNDLYVQSIISCDGDTITINADNTASTSSLKFNSTNYLRWNSSTGLFEFSDPLYISNTSVPAQFERRVTAGSVVSYELPSALRLTERVTDAGSNATDDGGPSLLFSRTSGTSGGAEVLFANIGAVYYGVTNTAEFRFNWSNDNFAESSPGVFPGTFNLLRISDVDAEFFNNSLYIDYTTLGLAQVGINTDTPAYTLDVNGDAHVDTDLTVDGDIYVSGYQIDINSPQAGQVIAYDGTKFVNDNTITFTNAAYRTQFTADIGLAGRVGSTIVLSNDTGATPYGQNDGSGLLIGVLSDTQTTNAFASISAAYDTGNNHQIRISTAPDGFVSDTATSITGSNTLVFSTAHGYSANDRILFISNTSNGLTLGTYYYVLATGLTATQCQVSLTQGGTAVTLTNGTGLTLVFNKSVRVITADQDNTIFAGQNITLNAVNPGVAGTDAYIYVERGTSGNDSAIKWNESTDRWQFTNDGSTYYNMVINLDDLSDVIITSPNKGQMLYYDGTDWVNSSTITFDSTTYYARFQNNTGITGQVGSGAIFNNQTGSTPYTTGDGSGILIGVDSNSQAISVFGGYAAVYDAGGNHSLRLSTSTDNFSTVRKDLAEFNDNDAAFKATQIILNAEGTASAAVDAQITVERGSTGTDAYIKWNEDPTPSNSRWEISDDLYVPKATIGVIDIDRTDGQIDTNSGYNLTLDSDGGTVFVNDNLNVDSGVLYVDAANNRVGINDTTPSYPLDVTGDINSTASVRCADVVVDGLSTYNTQSTTNIAVSATEPISETTRISQKVVIKITEDVTGELHMLEALAFRKGTTAYLTTYAEMYTNTALATFTADVSGGAIRILATNLGSNTLDVSVARISLD